jgi:hypothetical protein
MVGQLVQFDIAAPPTNVIFEHPASGVESVADRDIGILIRVVRRGITPDDNLVPRNFQVDTDAE